MQSRKSRNIWGDRQIWPWGMEWSRSKANRVLPRQHTGHSKHPLPTTQEKTLWLDITRWLILKSDWLFLCIDHWGRLSYLSLLFFETLHRNSWSEPQVSSESCFCWLYRGSPSLAAKNIINLNWMLTIWSCPCVESSLVLLEEGVCYDQCVVLAKLY